VKLRRHKLGHERVTGAAGVVAALVVLPLLSACGGPGEGAETSCTLCGEMNDLVGSISSKTGSQAVMQGWVVAAFERDTGIARVGEVNSAGLYTLSRVRTDKPHTLALFTPDYILQAVTSIPTDEAVFINQFVSFEETNIPKIINNGPIITFQEFRGISVEKDLASDQNGDGIPDGSAGIGAEELGLTLLADAIDTDLDGLDNEVDPDIDGDGVINVLDPDDNGNQILDVFDGDANGDYAPDTAPGETDTDGYFTEGVEFVAVQYVQRPKADGSGDDKSLTFTAKVRDDIAPTAVQVRGAPALLNNSTYVGYDADGVAVPDQTWNRLLLDDGKSEDSSPDDRLFAQKVILAEESKGPRAQESVFFQLAFEDGAWFMEFPYSFPNLSPSEVTADYEPNEGSVILISKPFGPDVTDFIWTINVYREGEEQAIWTSQAIPGDTTKFKIQKNIKEKGKTYQYTVVAQTLDKIQGYPAYTIYSKLYDLK
jgi:hypothetical protein